LPAEKATRAHSVLIFPVSEIRRPKLTVFGMETALRECQELANYIGISIFYA